MHADWRIAATSGSAGSAQRGIAHAPGELASKTHFHLVQISPSETIPLLRISILFLRSLLSYSFLFFFSFPWSTPVLTLSAGIEIRVSLIIV